MWPCLVQLRKSADPCIGSQCALAHVVHRLSKLHELDSDAMQQLAADIQHPSCDAMLPQLLTPSGNCDGPIWEGRVWHADVLRLHKALLRRPWRAPARAHVVDALRTWLKGVRVGAP